MKKVVIIHNRAVVGGPSVAIAEMIKKLNHQFEFFLIVGKPLPDEQDAMYLFENIASLKIIHLYDMQRMPSILGDWQAYRKLKKILKNISPDVVHTHGTKPGILGRLVASSLGVRTIVHTFHGHIFHGYFNKLISSAIVRVERWLAKKTTHIIVLGKVLHRDIVQQYKIAPENKVHILPLQFDLSAFRTEQENKRKLFREKYHIVPHTTVVSFVGRLTAIKNGSMYINVIKEMARLGQLKRFTFLIIGDGVEKTMLQQQLKQAAIPFANSEQCIDKQHNVIFTSWVKDMSAAMAASDVLCVTSINEGTPVCVIEAMAANVCVIATDVGSLSEMIDNEHTGFLVALNDVSAMCNKLKFIETNAEKIHEIKANAAQNIAKTYENADVWHNLINIYQF